MKTMKTIKKLINNNLVKLIIKYLKILIKYIKFSIYKYRVQIIIAFLINLILFLIYNKYYIGNTKNTYTLNEGFEFGKYYKEDIKVTEDEKKIINQKIQYDSLQEGESIPKLSEYEQNIIDELKKEENEAIKDKDIYVKQQDIINENN
jgi:hypothetical protein